MLSVLPVMVSFHLVFQVAANMIINKVLVPKLFEKSLRQIIKIQVARIYNRDAIGNRDWVAFGESGNAYYRDDPVFPFPAVRFKENCNELLALKEKEKGDWRKLCIEEKRILYRASFRQTLSEVRAPTGQWKSIVGASLVFISLGLWIFILEKQFIYNPLPQSFSDEWRAVTFRNLLVNKHGHLTGISSKWDYENDKWK